MPNFQLFCGDSLDQLKNLPDNSVDSIVCDPPYGLSFMGKKWDYDVPTVDVWKECLRVLKPGGHVLAFAGTRTQHRMAVRIEDAGFEVRDMLAWVYGSGFTKSMDVSKAIDKVARGDRVVALIYALLEKGHTISELGEKAGIPCLARSFRDWTVGGHRPEEKSWERLLTGLGLSEDDGLNVISRRTVKIGNGTTYTFRQGASRDYEIKDIAPSSPEAIAWEGWGTALKPALEPITLARKPLIGTVADNILRHGVGAINIDGCRVGDEGGGTHCNNRDKNGKCRGHNNAGRSTSGQTFHAEEKEMSGRFPANLIHDGSHEIQEVFGEASRFFYCAKASKKDREEGLTGSGDRKNNHPTVKPTDLMRYLCRLITPPGGTVLDPFLGSGSTGKAAMLEGFDFIGVDLSQEYVDISRARIEHARNQVEEKARAEHSEKQKPKLF